MQSLIRVPNHTYCMVLHLLKLDSAMQMHTEDYAYLPEVAVNTTLVPKPGQIALFDLNYGSFGAPLDVVPGAELVLRGLPAYRFIRSEVRPAAGLVTIFASQFQLQASKCGCAAMLSRICKRSAN